MPSCASTGRLDSEWASHLSDTLDDFLREGPRRSVLDMPEVTYISSAGTQVLGRPLREFLASSAATLHILNPSPVRARALRMVGLEDRLLYEEPADIPGHANPFLGDASRESTHTRADWEVPHSATQHGHYEFTPRDSDGGAHLPADRDTGDLLLRHLPAPRTAIG